MTNNHRYTGKPSAFAAVSAAVVCAAMLFTTSVIAQPAETPNAAANASDEAQAQAQAQTQTQTFTITITAVQGLVQFRADDESPWSRAEAGQEVPVGGEFRTGPRSAVSLSIGSDQSVTLDRLGVVKILEAIQGADGKARTDVGMKYGRSVMQVEQAGLEHESTIRTPSAVLAIRGSIGTVSEYKHTLFAGADSGDVSWTKPGLKGRQLKLPPGSHQTGESNSTAASNASAGTFNPVGGSSTPDEVALFSNNASGFFAASQQAGLGQISGAQSAPVVNQFDFDFSEFDEGLAFVAIWMTMPGSFTDLDLFVDDPLGRRIGAFSGAGDDPMNPSLDEVSDPFAFSPIDDAGETGAEAVIYPDGFPTGNYRVGIDFFSGSPATYQVGVVNEGTVKATTTQQNISSGIRDHIFGVDGQGNVTPGGLSDQ